MRFWAFVWLMLATPICWAATLSTIDLTSYIEIGGDPLTIQSVSENQLQYATYDGAPESQIGLLHFSRFEIPLDATFLVYELELFSSDSSGQTGGTDVYITPFTPGSSVTRSDVLRSSFSGTRAINVTSLAGEMVFMQIGGTAPRAAVEGDVTATFRSFRFVDDHSNPQVEAAPATLCPCADIYDNAIAAYEANGGDMSNSWRCATSDEGPYGSTSTIYRDVSDTNFLSLRATGDSAEGPPSPPIIYQCSARVSKEGSAIFEDEVGPDIGESQRAACINLQASICGGSGTVRRDLILTDDARIDGMEADSSRAYGNFGKRSTLFVHNYHPSKALLQFDTDPIDGQIVQQATLKLRLASLARGGAIFISPLVSYWNEDDVTWITQPAAEQGSVTLDLSPEEVGQVVSVDITELVRQQAASGRVGLVLQTSESLKALFDAKEASTGMPPVLEVVTGKQFKIDITVQTFDSGFIADGDTIPSGSPFLVYITTSNVNCSGSYVITELGTPGIPFIRYFPTAIVKGGFFSIGPTAANEDGSNDEYEVPVLLYADPAELPDATNRFKVSATCNGAAPSEFAHDTFEFFVR